MHWVLFKEHAHTCLAKLVFTQLHRCLLCQSYRVNKEARCQGMAKHGLEIALVGNAEPREVCLQSRIIGRYK